STMTIGSVLMCSSLSSSPLTWVLPLALSIRSLKREQRDAVLLQDGADGVGLPAKGLLELCLETPLTFSDPHGDVEGKRHCGASSLQRHQFQRRGSLLDEIASNRPPDEYYIDLLSQKIFQRLSEVFFLVILR